MDFDFEVIQPGQVADVDLTTPILSAEVVQSGQVVDVDRATPLLDVEVLYSGVVQDVWVLAGPPGPPGTPGTNGSITSVNGDAGPAVTLDASEIPETAAAKILTGTERTKLAGIATGATANSSDATLLARANHTGTQSADTLTDGATNKAFLATERTKLSGIATGATANSTDATLLARANHTGTQLAATISDFSTAADARITAANKKTDSMSTNKLLGRGTASTGAIEEITLGTNLTLTGTTLDATGGSGGALTAYKSSDTSRSLTATVASDPHLTLAVASSGIYAYEAWLYFTSTSATPDFKFQMSIPSGATLLTQLVGTDTASTPYPPATTYNIATTAAAAEATTAGAVLTATGTLTISATSGTAVLQWAQNTSNSTATILKAGSWMRLTKLN